MMLFLRLFGILPVLARLNWRGCQLGDYSDTC
jgi:hypothetical protein